jgi:hypothetical protein
MELSNFVQNISHVLSLNLARCDGGVTQPEVSSGLRFTTVITSGDEHSLHWLQTSSISGYVQLAMTGGLVHTILGTVLYLRTRQASLSVILSSVTRNPGAANFRIRTCEVDGAESSQLQSVSRNLKWAKLDIDLATLQRLCSRDLL